MAGYRKRLHLDRTELFVGLGLVLLTCSLMFTLGVLVGFGMRGDASAVAGSGADAHAVAGNAHADTHGAHAAGHGGASLSAATQEAVHGEGHDADDHASGGHEGTQEEAGSALKKAHVESKQHAMVELALSESAESRPKSVVDTDAHIEAVQKPREEAAAARAPASAPPTPAQPVSEPDKPAPLTGRVKSLFERTPDSLEEFKPVSGSYTLQIASYPTGDESKAKMTQLRKAGFGEAYVQLVRTKSGETWFRVNVGSYPNAQWAQRNGDKLLKRKLAANFFVRQVD